MDALSQKNKTHSIKEDVEEQKGNHTAREQPVVSPRIQQLTKTYSVP